jgi:hypothetical protein
MSNYRHHSNVVNNILHDDTNSEDEFLEEHATECHACFGTGLDRKLDADCLECWGEGSILVSDT